jgi:hypothetical protein
MRVEEEGQEQEDPRQILIWRLSSQCCTTVVSQSSLPHKCFISSVRLRVTHLASLLPLSLSLPCPIDPKSTGKIDIKEFLVTMVAFHDTTNDLNNDPPPQPYDLFFTEDPPPPFQDTIPSLPCPSATAPLATVPSTDDNGPCSGLDSEQQEDDEEHIRFYFNMFDYDSTGLIQLDEMKIMIRRIFVDLMNSASSSSASSASSPSSAATSTRVHDPPINFLEGQSSSSSPRDDDLTAVPSVADIEIMFENILQHSDINAKEAINYQEFKLFYNNLFTNSSKIIRKR